MKITVRKTKAEDIDYILEAESQQENAKFICGWDRNRHLAALSNDDLFHAIILATDKRVGFLILAGLQNPNRAVEFMRLVVTEKGRGFGRAALQWAKEFAFEKTKVHRLWLDVKTFNNRAKKLYESEGFTVEGTLRECLKTDQGFESLIVLSILEEEYRKVSKRY